jgi:hypothetical protein
MFRLTHAGFFSCPYADAIYLDGNHLEGPLPSTLGKLPGLGKQNLRHLANIANDR